MAGAAGCSPSGREAKVEPIAFFETWKRRQGEVGGADLNEIFSRQESESPPSWG